MISVVNPEKILETYTIAINYKESRTRTLRINGRFKERPKTKTLKNH